MAGIKCFDLGNNITGTDLGIIFPQFDPPRESIVLLSPHDDDAALGSGYLILACKKAGVDVHIVVLCDGRAGYTRAELKDTIVDIRRAETVKAYAKLGVARDHIHCYEYPDFSLQSYLGFEMPDGTEGAFGKIVTLLRGIGATRLVIPNGWMEHPDHTAAHEIGAFHGPQVGDPILPDRGAPSRIKSYLVYAVWGDLPPPDKPVTDDSSIRADLIMIAPLSFEKKVIEAIKCFKTQSDIIEGLITARSGRVRGNKVMEVYKRIEPRSKLDYDPYWRHIENSRK